jgi:hypothetical protein
LPETGSEVQSRENGRVGSAYVAYTFGDLLHRVFVDMGILVESEQWGALGLVSLERRKWVSYRVSLIS